MRRGDLERGSPPAGGPDDDLQPALATAAVLIDAVRRRIFQVVRRARRPLTRDEAASAARVSRNLAAFHLDKLVEAGLLRAATRPSAGARRAGRRPKVYDAGVAEVHLDVPPRLHGLLADILVDALRGADDGGARGAAVAAASRRGMALGLAAPRQPGVTGELARARAAVERLGFEPYQAEATVVRLGNCPFQPLALEAPELVCRLNQSLLAGLLDGLQTAGVEAVLAPRPGECCVELTVSPAGGGRSIR